MLTYSLFGLGILTLSITIALLVWGTCMAEHLRPTQYV